MESIVVIGLIVASIVAIVRGKAAQQAWRQEDARPGHVDYRG